MNSLIIKKEIIDDRNYGIDLLRIIAMFFVVILHCLGHGGVLDNVTINSSQYKLVWLIEIIAYCAVDVFAIISGYVSYTNKEKKINYSNYIKLWMQVAFYGIVINIFFNIINQSLVRVKDYLTVCLPVTKKLYWYFTAYTGLYIIMPIINKGIREIKDNALKKIFIIIFIVFTFWEGISSKFLLSSGYSFLWITLLYILGAIMKKTDIGKNFKNYQIIIGISFLYICTYICKIYMSNISLFGFTINGNMFVSYISPTILGVSILYVIYFSKIKFNNIFSKVIKFAAPSTFSIYIINEHYFVRENIIRNSFIGITNSSVIKILVIIIGFSFVFVIGSILIDRVRIIIFKKCKVKELANSIIKLINNIFEKIIKFI